MRDPEAHAERDYRRALKEFERLKKLLSELPNEPGIGAESPEPENIAPAWELNTALPAPPEAFLPKGAADEPVDSSIGAGSQCSSSSQPGRRTHFTSAAIAVLMQFAKPNTVEQAIAGQFFFRRYGWNTDPPPRDREDVYPVRVLSERRGGKVTDVNRITRPIVLHSI